MSKFCKITCDECNDFCCEEKDEGIIVRGTTGHITIPFGMHLPCGDVVFHRRYIVTPINLNPFIKNKDNYGL